MTVSNPASFSSIKAEFAGSANFKDYYRGGPYVPAGASSSISTTADGLRMSQFNGVSAFTATVSSTFATGGRSTSGTAVTNAVTAGPSGSTYAWSYVSGDTSIAISLASTAGPTWSASVSNANPTKNAIWRCLVTQGGNSGYTPNVSVTLSFTG